MALRNAPPAEPCALRVRAATAICASEIYNDGADSPIDWQAARTGVGISNLRTRLQILHGEESELQLRHADAGGVEAVVTLPLKEA